MSKAKESFRNQMVGFPWPQLLVIACVRFAEPIAFTSLFPYVYFMVKDFGIAKDEADVSKFSGYLASTFALCQVLSSMNWGKWADKHGRKPTVLIGLTGSMISLLMLGFAKNYWYALAARSIMGLLNGNVAVLRTMIGEIATERKHQAIAFSTMPLMFQVGCVIGPIIGGYLSGNTTRFDFLRPLVTKFPYALPNLCVATLLGTSFFIALFFLEETHHKHKYRRDYFIEIGDSFKRYALRIEPKQRSWNPIKITAEEPLTASEETALIDDDDDDDDDETECISYSATGASSTSSSDTIECVPGLTRRQSQALIRAYSIHEEGDEEEINYRALLTPHILYAVICNFIMNLHIVVHDEFLPVFLAYDVARNADGSLVSKPPLKLVGGLGFNSQDTGQILSSTGILGIFFLTVVFPWVDRKFDCLTTYKRFILIFPFIYLAVPYYVFLANYSKGFAKVIIYILTCLKTLGTSIAFPQILLIVHNSSDPKHRALINGAAISVSALARFIGPLTWGFFMSWGQTFQIGWLGWWLISLLSILAIYQSQFLRDSTQEEEQGRETTTH